MKLNLTLFKKKDGTIIGEFRKKITINEENQIHFIDLFSNSLEGKPIQSKVIIAFRDPFISANRLKEFGLLKKGTQIKID